MFREMDDKEMENALNDEIIIFSCQITSSGRSYNSIPAFVNEGLSEKDKLVLADRLSDVFTIIYHAGLKGSESCEECGYKEECDVRKENETDEE